MNLTNEELADLEAKAKRAAQGPFTNHVDPTTIQRLISEVREKREKEKR